jgi:hypothetical protein
MTISGIFRLLLSGTTTSRNKFLHLRKLLCYQSNRKHHFSNKEQKLIFQSSAWECYVSFLWFLYPSKCVTVIPFGSFDNLINLLLLLENVHTARTGLTQWQGTFVFQVYIFQVTVNKPNADIYWLSFSYSVCLWTWLSVGRYSSKCLVARCTAEASILTSYFGLVFFIDFVWW